MARQGVHYHTTQGLMVADPQSMEAVPNDGQTMGEVMLRGNTVMKGYLKNAQATEEAFRGGWYHTGDLAVRHPDGYVEVKDRSKDIIITGGENVSSLEVEEALYKHPEVMEAAVVARPDPHWGETVCAFVTLRPGAAATDAEVIVDWCRQSGCPLQGAEDGGVRSAAEDLHRQGAEVRIEGTGEGARDSLNGAIAGWSPGCARCRCNAATSEPVQLRIRLPCNAGRFGEQP